MTTTSHVGEPAAPQHTPDRRSLHALGHDGATVADHMVATDTTPTVIDVGDVLAADRSDDIRLAGWAARLGPPGPEESRRKLMARLGGLAAITAIVMYLTWRATATLPSGANRPVAIAMLMFEALPLPGMILKVVTLWNIDSEAPRPILPDDPHPTCVLMIPTYNEPAEVIAPTIAAAVALQPAHETWVLDDGDRPFVAELCERYGARYVTRPEHSHAKAGNMNHALGILAAERCPDGLENTEDAAERLGVIAVLDCDHVPLPHFLTATLGWFDDPTIALVQGPQAFYNSGAFDDDGITGEQGLFFNVLMPARNHAGAGPFWCGSSSLLRVSALLGVGGVATETITEDMHTTLKLIRAGWRTTYHHQVIAVGLAPETPDQYLLQRRRWGMGAMQIITHERLWAAKRWMSWRNFHEYLNGTLWWLEGIATVVAFTVPIAVLLTGAHTSTAGPVTFAVMFTTMFVVRLWGAKRLLRGEIRWATAFALRIYRIPVGLACAWWLVTRSTLTFEVTPKGGADERHRGRTPTVISALAVVVAAAFLLGAASAAGLTPMDTDPASALMSMAWISLCALALTMGVRRIRDEEFATSRRMAYRAPVAVTAILTTDVLSEPGRTRATNVDVVNLSVTGAALRCSYPLLAGESAELTLPGTDPVTVTVLASRDHHGDHLITVRTDSADLDALRTISMWMFHTPVAAGLDAPAIARI